MSLPLLEIRNLCAARAGETVLNIEELTIDRGDVMAVVGPNGAGKSTLLLILARLLHPEKGTIHLNGKSISDESDLAYRRKIALVLQDPLLFDMSVFDNIATGLRFRGLGRREIEKKIDLWLDRLDISSLKRRRATELSGGEAQRVSLARAFVLEPQLLLLDEPFSALDPPTRKRLLSELSVLLSATETTTILVTHNLAEAIQLGKRMAIILAGALRKVGTPDEILHGSDEPEIVAFTQGFDIGI